jgi:hypothetical protein
MRGETSYGWVGWEIKNKLKTGVGMLGIKNIWLPE